MLRSLVLASAATELAPAVRQWAVDGDFHDSPLKLHAVQGLHGDGRSPVLKIDKGKAAGAAGLTTGDPQRLDLPEGREDIH